MKKEHKIIALIIVGLLIWILGPHLLYLIDTSMNDNTSIDYAVESQKTNLVNQYRVTVTQAFVGIAVLYGVYQGWQRITIAEDNLKVSQEGQITERFTRAIDQLGAYDHVGKPVIEIRLGGIYALERISTESEKDYWAIMEILTAYVRKNSPIENENIKHEEVQKQSAISLDIQAILTVIQRSKSSFNTGESNFLDLQKTNLQKANLQEADLIRANLQETNLIVANLQEANLRGANLQEANLRGANLEKTNLEKAELERANFQGANLQKANLQEAHLGDTIFQWANLELTNLQKANLRGANLEQVELFQANLKGAILYRVNLKGARLIEANLEGANLERADLRGARNLSLDQLSKVKTLYNAELDEELRIPLREKYPALFDKPDE